LTQQFRDVRGAVWFGLMLSQLEGWGPWWMELCVRILSGGQFFLIRSLDFLEILET